MVPLIKPPLNNLLLFAGLSGRSARAASSSRRVKVCSIPNVSLSPTGYDQKRPNSSPPLEVCLSSKGGVWCRICGTSCTLGELWSRGGWTNVAGTSCDLQSTDFVLQDQRRSSRIWERLLMGWVSIIATENLSPRSRRTRLSVPTKLSMLAEFKL